MSKKRLFIILLFLVIALASISSASAGQNESASMEMAVDDDLALPDSGDVLCDSDSEIANTTAKSFTDLNKTINSNNDKNIYLKDNYTFNSSSDSGFEDGIVIKRAVTVWGNGVTIDGNHMARIFNVKNSNVVFHDIVFVNGKTTKYGGAIYGKCSALNCTFNNNSAYSDYSGYGGAMYGGSAVNCTFNNNKAYDGGAMCGGSAKNCKFIQNKANGFGGAMCGGSAVNCTFMNNSAWEGGAFSNGLFYDVEDSYAVNCTFNNNKASYGGAMYECSAVNCKFLNNHADEGGAMYGGSAAGCTFKNNSAKKGGAINGYDFDISEYYAVNCIFINNSAKAGGAICCRAGDARYGYSVGKCAFINNSAVNGGAMFGGKASRCKFDSNSATKYGGAVYQAKLSTNCQFNNNTAPAGKNVYGVKWFKPTKTFKDLYDLINNNKKANIYLKCSYSFDIATDLNFKGGIQINRSVTIWGNGFTINGNDEARIFKVTKGNVVFRNIKFVNAMAATNGGAIFGKCKAIGCTFKNNYAYNGAAMYGGSAVNCIFNKNKASKYAGAMYGGSAVKCSFIDNYAYYGGAMYKGSASACSFKNNKAYVGGGAMYNGHAVNCIFNNNSYGSLDTGMYGGAMYGGSAVKCTFNNNKAYDGGAMYGGSAVSCIFNNNKAYDGGGAMYKGSAVKCVFNNNKAGYWGGATYLVTAKLCKFVKNNANYGGAMSEGKQVKCVFKSNKAKYFGDTFYKHTEIYSSDMAAIRYKTNNYLVATLKDYLYRPIKAAKLIIRIGDWSKSFRTDSKGQVKMSTKNLAPGKYHVKIIFAYKNIMKSFTTVRISVVK